MIDSFGTPSFIYPSVKFGSNPFFLFLFEDTFVRFSVIQKFFSEDLLNLTLTALFESKFFIFQDVDHVWLTKKGK